MHVHVYYSRPSRSAPAANQTWQTKSYQITGRMISIYIGPRAMSAITASISQCIG